MVTYELTNPLPVRKTASLIVKLRYQKICLLGCGTSLEQKIEISLNQLICRGTAAGRKNLNFYSTNFAGAVEKQLWESLQQLTKQTMFIYIST